MKEKSDFLEVEFKFLGAEAADAVAVLAGAAPAGTRLAQKAHTAFFDLYLDTEALTLHERGHGFRLRFDAGGFRKGGRFKANFKTPELRDGHRVLSRREVRSDLKRDEVLPLPSTSLPGLAAELAYEAAAEPNRPRPPLGPVLLISSMRRYFTVKAPSPDQPDLMLMAIEHSTALDGRGVDMRDLLSTGTIGWTPAPATVDFTLGELELTVEDDPAADAMFRTAVERLAARYSSTTVTKYDYLVERLQLAPTGAAPPA